MALIIPDKQFRWSRVIQIIIIIVVLVAIVWALWKYIYIPYKNGQIFQPALVSCTLKPDPPTKFAVTMQPNNRAYVSWTASTNMDSYTLYVGKTPSFFISNAIRTIKIDKKSTSIMVLNLIPIMYYFKMVANNSCGASANTPEISLNVTSWPTAFKLCKRDNPTICTQFDGAFEYVRMTDTCEGTQCNLYWQDLQKIKLYTADLCLNESNISGTNIEDAVTSDSCNLTGAWDINPTTGKISNSNGLCLGAGSTKDSAAYNTTCSLLATGDARYIWDVVAISN